MSLSASSGSVRTLVAGAQHATAQAALAARGKAFRALHERGCFVIPNPSRSQISGSTLMVGLVTQEIEAIRQ